MTITPFYSQIDFLNRKQLAKIAREQQIYHHAYTTAAQLVTAIKAK